VQSDLRCPSWPQLWHAMEPPEPPVGQSREKWPTGSGEVSRESKPDVDADGLTFAALATLDVCCRAWLDTVGRAVA
jgi:hypothetical protein